MLAWRRSLSAASSIRWAESWSMIWQGVPQVVGGEIWAQFMGCKINHHAFSSSQGSLAKRSYDWMAKRVKWGDLCPEQ